MKRSRLRATYKPKGYDLKAAERWHRTVLHKAVCAVCGGREGLEAHHGVPKAAIEDFAREERYSNERRNELLWAEGNGVSLCRLCHGRHTNAFRRVPLTRLPTSVVLFAVELGALATRRGSEWAMVRLEREYPRG